MKRKVGEIFNCNGITLSVAKECSAFAACTGCFFKNTRCWDYADIIGECQSASRSDGGVIFVKVEEKDMKERNIKLSLEKAKEFYRKGGELRNLALSAFTEHELDKRLPKSWAEFLETEEGRNRLKTPTTIDTHKPVEFIALSKLYYLRDLYRQGWEPNWKDKSIKYCIKSEVGHVYPYTSQQTNHVLSFQDEETAVEFMENFGTLIQQAGDLI